MLPSSVYIGNRLFWNVVGLPEAKILLGQCHKT